MGGGDYLPSDGLPVNLPPLLYKKITPVFLKRECKEHWTVIQMQTRETASCGIQFSHDIDVAGRLKVAWGLVKTMYDNGDAVWITINLYNVVSPSD